MKRERQTPKMKSIYARVQIIRTETNASNYKELAFQDYVLYFLDLKSFKSSLNTLNPAGPGIFYFYVSVELHAYSLYFMAIFVSISYGHRRLIE